MSDVPVVIRRTTMMVNEIESALTIYRDILGMQVHYDEEIIVSGQGLPAGETRLLRELCQGRDRGGRNCPSQNSPDRSD